MTVTFISWSARYAFMSVCNFIVIKGQNYCLLTGRSWLPPPPLKDWSVPKCLRQHAIPKIKILCNLHCLKTRLRPLYNKSSTGTAAWTSFQNSLSYVTFLFSKWRIWLNLLKILFSLSFFFLSFPSCQSLISPKKYSFRITCFGMLSCRPISQHEKLVYNGEISSSKQVSFLKVGWMWYKFCNSLVTTYFLPYHEKCSYLDYLF